MHHDCPARAQNCVRYLHHVRDGVFADGGTVARVDQAWLLYLCTDNHDETPDPVRVFFCPWCGCELEQKGIS